MLLCTWGESLNRNMLAEKCLLRAADGRLKLIMKYSNLRRFCIPSHTLTDFEKLLPM